MSLQRHDAGHTKNDCIEVECADSDCETHNPITEEDVICSKCGEHSEMREHTGTECCGGGSRFE